jgi:SAM-dependent methyltransferase
LETEVYDYFFRAEEAHWWFRARRRILAGFLARLHPQGGLRIADVGCGTGGMLPILGRLGTVTGVDEAPEARDYCARRGFPDVRGMDDWHRDGKAYDLITAFDVVEHVEDDVAFLSGLRRRLAAGGSLLVTVPAYPFLWSVFDKMNHHKRRYTRKSLKRSLAASGFRVVRMTHMNTFLFPALAGARLVEKVGGREPRTPAERRAALDRWFRVGPLNGVLEAIFSSEGRWLAVGDLPFGASILALVRDAES